MSEPGLDLLSDPLFSVRGGSAPTLTLPEVLAGLAAGQPLRFTALQRHQRHAWLAFLVQTAALGLHHRGETDPTLPAELWAETLLALAGDEASAWRLHEPDLARPAFLQPPVPEGTLDRFGEPIDAPDGLDVLVTARNFDVKAARIQHPRPEHWAYALISLQTTQGFSGRANYGVARMNGGFSNRPSVSFARDPSLAGRFRRDLRLLLDARERLCEEHSYPEQGGLGLLWLHPWDGASSSPLHACDPFFVEICRRVRLIARPGGIAARGIGTEKSRLDAREAKGNTGDPWTPIRKDPDAPATALTVSAEGLHYRLLSDLLLAKDWTLGAAGAIQPTDAWLTASALARGQGKTEGFHERVVPVPPAARASLRSEPGRRRLGELARGRVELVATLSGKALRPALLTLLNAGERGDPKDERPRRWTAALQDRIDARFFEDLWQAAQDDQRSVNELNFAWAGAVLWPAAQEVFASACDEVPLPAARRYRALAAAEGVLHGAARKHLPSLFPDRPPAEERA